MSKERAKSPRHVVFQISNLSPEKKVERCHTVLDTAGKSTRSIPTAVSDSKDTLKSAVDDLASANSAVTAAKAALLKAEADQTAKEELVNQAAAGYRNSVDTHAKGDESIVSSLGLDLSAPKVRQSTAPATPADVVVSVGKGPGTANVSWAKTKGATNYNLQTSIDPPTPDTWKHADNATKKSTVLSDLPTGKRTWVRVQATGAAGKGEWSTELPVTAR